MTVWIGSFCCSAVPGLYWAWRLCCAGGRRRTFRWNSPAGNGRRRGGRPAVALWLQNHAPAPLTLLAFEWDGTRWELPVTVGPRAAREITAVFPLPEEGFPEPGAEVALTVETLSGSSLRRLRLPER